METRPELVTSPIFLPTLSPFLTSSLTTTQAWLLQRVQKREMAARAHLVVGTHFKLVLYLTEGS